MTLLQQDKEKGSALWRNWEPTQKSKESELERIYHVSRTTIRKAIKMLVEEETLEVRQGRGTKVLNYKAKQNYIHVSSVTETLRKRGYDVKVADMENYIPYAMEEKLKLRL